MSLVRGLFLITFTIISCWLKAQLPALDVHNLQGKRLHVAKHSIVPLKGTSNGKKYSYTIVDSTYYTAFFDKIKPNSDTSYLITFKVENYNKVIYADGILLHRDTMSRFLIAYMVLLNGEYKNIFVSDRIAQLEGYYHDDNVFTFDDLNNRKQQSNILNIYKSGNYYRHIDEVKMKLFPELYWLHLFSSIKKDREDYKSSQAVFLDMKLDRIPSILKFAANGNDFRINMEVDYLKLYEGVVSDEDLQTIASTDPDDFFFRISSDANYQWNRKLNIPKSISAVLTTKLRDRPEDLIRIDSCHMEITDN